MRKPKYTFLDCKYEASRFSTRSDFSKKSTGAYLRAWRMGWLNSICQHMSGTPYEKLDYDECKEIASNYDIKGEFRTKEIRAYMKAYRKGWLDDICSHMRRKSRNKNVQKT